MRIIAIKKLREFWLKNPDAEQPLRAWYKEAEAANWIKLNDITKYYRTASILSGNRVVFNIKGNDYRLITTINYDYKVVYIRFIGTHKEYDRINAEDI